MDVTAGEEPDSLVVLINPVIAEALIFVPLLFIANFYAPGAITSAATVTISTQR